MKNKMMKIALFSILTLIFMSFTTVKKPHYESCGITNSSFQDGEKLTYKLYYNWGYLWMSAGEVDFTVEDLGDEYHVKAVGRTYRKFDWFFKVRDTYEAFLDKETLLPNVTIRSVREGGYRLYDKLIFDRINGKVTSYRGDYETDAKPKVYDIKQCTNEMLSIVYYFRNVKFGEFDKGAEFPIDIFMDKETWPLNVKYKGVVSKKVSGFGTKKYRKFSPQMITGDVFKDGAGVDVYVSDDKDQIPYLIELPLSVGMGKAILKQ